MPETTEWVSVPKADLAKVGEMLNAAMDRLAKFEEQLRHHFDAHEGEVANWRQEIGRFSEEKHGLVQEVNALKDEKRGLETRSRELDLREAALRDRVARYKAALGLEE